MENVCKPGSTLLWDLLQDDKIVSICTGNLARPMEVKGTCGILIPSNQMLWSNAALYFKGLKLKSRPGDRLS
jgi:hypothetical protein